MGGMMHNTTIKTIQDKYGYSISHIRKLARDNPGVAVRSGRIYLFDEKRFAEISKRDPKQSAVQKKRHRLESLL